MSEQDDFEFGEFDRRLAARLKAVGLPPLVPRLWSSGEARSGAATSSRAARRLLPAWQTVLGWLVLAWFAYSVGHLLWFVFWKA